jgi:hypothetical protein
MRVCELARACQFLSSSFTRNPFVRHLPTMLRPQFLAQSSRAAARRLYSSRGSFFLQKRRRNGPLIPYSAPVTPYMRPACSTRRCSSSSLEETKPFLGYAIMSYLHGLKTQGRCQVQTRAYADGTKFSRSKPHMNIGTIGMSTRTFRGRFGLISGRSRRSR